VKSGFDFPIDDWSTFDAQVADISDRQFAQKTFYSYPSLRAKKPDNEGWYVSKPYHGEEFDDTCWTLIPGGWDHEHCSLCYCDITDGMTYWSNDREVVILCDYCHEHYQNVLSQMEPG
jgi:hypothetical protein